MRVTGWRGASVEKQYRSYGVRIGIENRRAFFNNDSEKWQKLTIENENGDVIEAELTPGFWRDCPEIRHPAFRDWFQAQGLIPWKNGSPPAFELSPLGEKDTKRFRLRLI